MLLLKDKITPDKYEKFILEGTSLFGALISFDHTFSDMTIEQLS